MTCFPNIETPDDLCLDRFVDCLLDAFSAEIQELKIAASDAAPLREDFQVKGINAGMPQKFPISWSDREPPNYPKQLRPYDDEASMQGLLTR